MKLTARNVEALKLDGKSDLIVFDDAMPGFGYRLRLSAGGKILRSWIVQYRRLGQSRRLLLGSAHVLGAEAARTMAKKALGRVANGEDPQASRRDRRAKEKLMRRTSNLFLAALMILAAPALRAEEPIDIGSRLELFVDRFLIDKLDGAELKMPEPRAEEKVLFFDKPWEGPTSAYVTVFKDGDRFRMYYRGSGQENDPKPHELTCYAESEDGKRKGKGERVIGPYGWHEGDGWLVGGGPNYHYVACSDECVGPAIIGVIEEIRRKEDERYQ